MEVAPIDALIVGMVFLTVFLLLIGLQGRKLRAERPLEERLTHLGLRSGPVSGDGNDEELRSREALKKALKELEALQKSEGRSYLRHLLKSSGVGRSLAVHVGISVIVAILVFAISLLLNC